MRAISSSTSTTATAAAHMGRKETVAYKIAGYACIVFLVSITVQVILRKTLLQPEVLGMRYDRNCVCAVIAYGPDGAFLQGITMFLYATLAGCVVALGAGLIATYRRHQKTSVSK